MQGTQNATINIAATVFLHIAAVIHAMDGSPEDYARTPTPISAKADRATTAQQSIIPP